MGRGRRYSSSDDERDRSKRHRDGSRAKRRRSPSAEGSAADAYARRRHRSRSPDRRRSDRSRDRVRSRNRRGISRSRSPRGSENSRNNVASVSPDRDYRPKRRRPRSRSRSKARSRPRSKRRNRSRSKSRSRSRDYKRRERRRERRRRSSSRSRSRSPHRRADRYRDASRSPPRKSRKRSPSLSPSPPPARSRKPLPSQDVSFRGTREGAVATSDDKPPPEMQKPNYGNTGILARETNVVAGTNIVLKYNEPPDARKPPSSQEWRLYVFKGQDLLNTIPIHTRSCWLMGREIAIADMHVEHPSISKQHAVIQFKHSVNVNEFGDRESRVKPYILDLESSNGTTLNGEKIQPTRFVELRDKDVIKLGLSEREYVVMLPPKD